jgi:integrase
MVRDPAALSRPSLSEQLTATTLADFVHRERTRGLRWSSIATTAGNAIGMARAIGPDLNLQQLKQLWAILDGVEARARREPRVARTIARPEDLYDAGLAEMEAALDGQSIVVDPDGWQAGLIVALLAATPVRISNFSTLELGRQIWRTDAVWHLRLDAAETKTHRTDAWPVPEGLTPYLDHFVEVVRPEMLRRATPPLEHARLWVGVYGQPLEHQGVRARIQQVTADRLGRAVRPHSFRHSAATAFTVDHPDRPRQAAALLGHAGFRTTERHYVVSQRQVALISAHALIERFRRRGTPVSEKAPDAPDLPS